MRNLQLGEQQKIYGLELVEFNGEGFVKKMRELAVRILKDTPEITIDDLRIIADRFGIVSHTSHCWGSIFKGKLFKAVGFRKSEIVSNHARRVTVWSLADFN